MNLNFLTTILYASILTFVSSMVLTTETSVNSAEQAQVFLRSTVLSKHELHSIGKFRVLKQPQRCSYVNLTSCHINQDRYDSYYKACYSNVCAKDRYFCLNGLHGNTVHICGQTETCKKRSRDIVVFNTTMSDYVDVYSIDCPVGFFQSNKGNCFTRCLKDESIVMETATRAHCDSKNGFCSVKRVRLFEVGSEEDECLDASRDLHLQCDITEELLPDCSCDKKCLLGEERKWNQDFMCSSTSRRGDQRNTVLLTSTQHPSQNTSQKVGTSIKNTDENLSVKDEVEQNSGDNQMVQSVTVVVVVPAVLTTGVILVIVLGGWYLINIRYKGKTSSQRNNNEPNTNNVHHQGNENQNMCRLSSAEGSETFSDRAIINGDEPQLEELKENMHLLEDNQVDSGNISGLTV